MSEGDTGEMYVDYQPAMKMFGLQTLHERRQKRCLDFAIKSVKHSRNRRLFPLNPVNNEHYLREKEVFQVNHARTGTYMKSTIPFCQRLLNYHVNSA